MVFEFTTLKPQFFGQFSIEPLGTASLFLSRTRWSPSHCKCYLEPWCSTAGSHEPWGSAVPQVTCAHTHMDGELWAVTRIRHEPIKNSSKAMPLASVQEPVRLQSWRDSCSTIQCYSRRLLIWFISRSCEFRQSNWVYLNFKKKIKIKKWDFIT